jgi:hypothetical protein
MTLKKGTREKTGDMTGTDHRKRKFATKKTDKGFFTNVSISFSY